MSTEINVRVDRELLLQRDRVQRQAQRQFVLEKNGQKLLANRSQELVAASGARGGENRIRSVRTGTSTQAVPITPVTAPYQRQPLPQLGGAAGGIVSREGSYLALPVPYGPYSFTALDTNNQLNTLIGSKVARNGGPEDRYVAAYDAPPLLNYPSPAYPPNSPNSWRPVVADDLWTVEADSYYRDYIYTDVLGSLVYGSSGMRRELEIGRAVDMANVQNNQAAYRKPLRKQAFTAEAIVRSGSAAIGNNTGIPSVYQGNVCELYLLGAEIAIASLAVDQSAYTGESIYDAFNYFAVSFNFYANAGQLGYIKARTPNTAGVPSNYQLIGFSQPFGLFNPSDIIISNASSSLNHVALVYDGTYFYCYWQGQRLAMVSKSSLGITGALPPFYNGDRAYIRSYIEAPGGYERTGLPTGPVVTPAIKCIRVTTNQALYTSESFTPPTSITRLA